MQTEILTTPHEKLEEMQLDGLKKTALSCYENIPFYKKSFDDAGFDPKSISSLEDLQKMPFVT